MKVRIADDVSVCVDDDIASMTTWVLLEQEDWFEDEIAFLRRICREDWLALDVGANHGVYALALARRGARVWAFEPATVPFRRATQSVAENGFADRVTPVPIGLSDRARRARLAVSRDSELNTLHPAGGRAARAEMVSLETLDSAWGTIFPAEARIDFLKLDAEGEERAILDGGARFFREQDPLVMLEVKHGEQVNLDLVSCLRAVGYDVYRLVPGLDLLVPLDVPKGEGRLDPFTLNLFACKRGRAAALAERGRLLSSGARATAVPALEMQWNRELLRLPALSARLPESWRAASLSHSYAYPLLAWCGSRVRSMPAAERLALLSSARQSLEADCDSAAACCLLVRVLADLGERARALAAARALQAKLPPGKMTVDPPAPPALGSFETQPVRRDVGLWLRAALDEYVQRAEEFSGYFASPAPGRASALLANPEHSVEAERRAVLAGRRDGVRMALPPDSLLFREAADHHNAPLWRTLTSAWGYCSDS